MISMRLFLTLLFLIGTCKAWGHDGHYIIGETSYQLLSEDAKESLHQCNYMNESLGDISTWADRVKKLPHYRWTSVLHYSDIPNDPPGNCSVVSNSTLPHERNLISYVTVYQQRLEKYPCASQFYFNMMVHMLQDLFQPLHLTGKERGGNDRQIIVNGTTYNLHTFWDSSLLDYTLKRELGKGYNLQEAVSYFVNRSSYVITEKSNQTFVEELFQTANSVLHQNCNLVWRYDSDDYLIESSKLLLKLIDTAIMFLSGTLENIYNDKSKLQMKNPIC